MSSKLDRSNCPANSLQTCFWTISRLLLYKLLTKLGFSTKKNKDWFDENNPENTGRKISAHQTHLAHATKRRKDAAPFIASFEIFRMKGGPTLQKELSIAPTGDYRWFYEALKAVYGPIYQTNSPLWSADGKVLLTENYSILNRWLVVVVIIVSSSSS